MKLHGRQCKSNITVTGTNAVSDVPEMSRVSQKSVIEDGGISFIVLAM